MSQALLRVQKRHGAVVDYRQDKIANSVRLCLINGCGLLDNVQTTKMADEVSAKVEQMLVTVNGHVVKVETIQDLVVLHLELLDPAAARAYRAYREEHRKLREERPVDEKTARLIREDGKYFGSDAQRFQHTDKYARDLPEEGRRETWIETTARVMRHLRWAAEHYCENAQVTEDDWAGLREEFIGGAASTSMRLVQMAGPAARREPLTVFNCAAAGIDDITRFADGLYILMQGSGLGFSCESEFIEDLPKVKRFKQKGDSDVFEVADSTEGWCDSLKAGLERWFDGYDVAFNYDQIRSAGSSLKTKGGTASGPEPLRRLHDFARQVILNRQRRRLRDIDVHDIMCYIGQIVQVGGVRRAAEISLSDLDSPLMREAKFGDFFNDSRRRHRTMANNSAVYESKPDAKTFMEEWLSLAKSGSGERGIFNRQAIQQNLPARRKALHNNRKLLWLANPCGEAILMPDGGLCNLSISVVRPEDSVEDLKRKVIAAAAFGTLQSTMTHFNYVAPSWRRNAEAERLLGVDLLGAMDNPLLRAGNPDRPALLEMLKQTVIDTNVQWAQKLNINPSVATTVIKPGGNSSVRYGTGQTMSGWLAKHIIRNVQVGRLNPMHQFLIDAGVPHEPYYNDPDNISVFSFPLKAPDGALIVSELMTDAAGNVTAIKPVRSAIEQLEDWKVFSVHWAEHAVSCTIYVADDEWVEVGHWVYKHWDHIKGLSFLPLDGGVYRQAPLTPVTEAKYEQFLSKFPHIAWEKLPRYTRDGLMPQQQMEFACTGDACLV